MNMLCDDLQATETLLCKKITNNYISLKYKELKVGNLIIDLSIVMSRLFYIIGCKELTFQFGKLSHISVSQLEL